MYADNLKSSGIICILILADSTVVPPKTVIFFNERFMAARHKEGCYLRNVPVHLLVCNGLSNNGVGVARDTVFQEVRPGAGFKTSDFVKKMLGGLP